VAQLSPGLEGAFERQWALTGIRAHPQRVGV